MSQDWSVTEDGQCQPCPTPRDWDLLETPYRFYRFLTEVEDSLNQATTVHQCECLPDIRRLVRKLVLNSYWLQTQRPEINPAAEAAFLNLYDEIGFPLTVQVETHVPGAKSSIHNHGTWGIVAVLQGQEKNTLWKRSPEPEWSNKVVCVAEQTLTQGDVVSFVPAAIHSIQAIGEEPLVTFNVYGETESKERFEFDPITHQAKNY
ncbi:cupin [Vacuolonema iberomarrocanum]|uniref:cupin n=1 Tax=Vacuolonema iberomarrocanum TaxID=3454632 RepID=UPI0019D95141|nr:cupin [filamentous cyanobacterium LEGE 07170]